MSAPAKHASFFRRRYGALEIAIFEWPTDDGRFSHTTKLTYSFKRMDSDDWETSEYLPTSELLPAAKLLVRRPLGDRATA